MKWCPKCSQQKDAADFNKNKARPSGLSDYCKACMRLVLADHRQRNAERLRAEGRERARKNYAADPEAAKKKDRKWRDSNPEKVRETKKRTYEKHRSKNLAYARNYRETHPEEVRQRWQVWSCANADSLRERHHIRYTRDTAHEIARVHRYRARKAGSGGVYTAEQWQQLISHYAPSGQCLACGNTSSLTVDHVISLSRGGANTISNLQCLCLSCNTKKKDQSTDYRPDLGLFAQSLERIVTCQSSD